MDLSPDQLHQITFNLCWVFAKALTPVSYAAPAYYADRLAERGRCYLLPFLTPFHPDRPRIEATLLDGLTITATTTMQQKDSHALRSIRSGFGNPKSPHWVDVATRPNPQHGNLGNTMFYI